MKAPLLLLSCFSLAAGCATAPAATAVAAEIDMTEAKATMSAYMICVHTAAKRYSLTETTATEATEAALGRCNNEFTAHKLAIREAFLKNTSDVSGAMRDANALADETRESARGRTMSQILEFRDQIAR